MAEFKPNIYPIMYWALAYGVIAGFLLFLAYLLSRYITIIWFPVFLAGLVWGGFRNYKKQQRFWSQQSGVPIPPKPPMQEFREAVNDVVQASREMVAENRAEDAAIADQEAANIEDQMMAEEQSAAEAAAPPSPPAAGAPPSQGGENQNR